MATATAKAGKSTQEALLRQNLAESAKDILELARKSGIPINVEEVKYPTSDGGEVSVKMNELILKGAKVRISDDALTFEIVATQPSGDGRFIYASMAKGMKVSVLEWTDKRAYEEVQPWMKSDQPESARSEYVLKVLQSVYAEVESIGEANESTEEPEANGALAETSGSPK